MKSTSETVEMSQNGGSTTVTVTKTTKTSTGTKAPMKGRNLLFLSCFVLSQVLAIVAVILLITWCQKYMGGFDWAMTIPEIFKEFNFHPLFLIMGLVIINGEAQLLYRVFPVTNRWRVKYVHAALHLISFILVVIGLQAEFELKDVLNVTDMYSLHSWLGMGAVVMFTAQLVCGVLLFLLAAIQCPTSERGERLRRLYHPVHRFFGAAILVLSTACVLMGITTKFFISDDLRNSYHDLQPRHAIGNALGCILVLFTLVTIFLLVNDDFRPSNRNVDEEKK